MRHVHRRVANRIAESVIERHDEIYCSIWSIAVARIDHQDALDVDLVQCPLHIAFTAMRSTCRGLNREEPFYVFEDLLPLHTVKRRQFHGLHGYERFKDYEA